jgi:predicted lactoylglutathione lyase
MPGPIIVSLPIADRPQAFRFYRELGFDPVGSPAEDGVPEPCLFALNPGVQLMLVPSGGFGWVAEGHEVAPPGTSECLLSFAVDGNEQVDAFAERRDRPARP